MFVSTYETAIDAKGRVSVPAPFRAALSGGSRVFLWPAIDGSGCLEGGGDELMSIYRQTLARMAPNDPNRRAFAELAKLGMVSVWMIGFFVLGTVFFVLFLGKLFNIFRDILGKHSFFLTLEHRNSTTCQQ